MAQVLNLRPFRTPSPTQNHHRSPLAALDVRFGGSLAAANYQKVDRSWTLLHRRRECKTAVACLFSNNRKQEQARIALESALGGKKTEFEKWDKEIKKREARGGGGGGGGGGWFKRFGGSGGDDHFWQDAQQTSLTLLGILVMFLIIAKGDQILAVIINPLLFALRGSRNGLTFLTSMISGKGFPHKSAVSGNNSKEEVYAQFSAKDRVVRKWRSD